MPGTLTITFRGPFVFSVESDHIDVYAPKCEDHAAGLFWAAGEYPLSGLSQFGGAHTYTVRGAGINPGGNPATITHLPVKPGMDGGILPGPAGAKPQTQHAFFHLSVPRPKLIYGMHPASAEVVKTSSGPTGVNSNYATGVRFYYDWTVGSDILMDVPFYQPSGSTNPPPVPIHVTPPSGNGLPDFGDIELQYDGPDSGDATHNDAISCFEQIALVAGVPWWLHYYDPNNTGMLVHSGVDCKAMSIILGA
jgi:hypothetical protein